LRDDVNTHSEVERGERDTSIVMEKVLDVTTQVK
jgi:hypothetical protein